MMGNAIAAGVQFFHETGELVVDAGKHGCGLSQAFSGAVVDQFLVWFVLVLVVVLGRGVGAVEPVRQCGSMAGDLVQLFSLLVVQGGTSGGVVGVQAAARLSWARTWLRSYWMWGWFSKSANMVDAGQLARWCAATSKALSCSSVPLMICGSEASTVHRIHDLPLQFCPAILFPRRHHRLLTPLLRPACTKAFPSPSSPF